MASSLFSELSGTSGITGGVRCITPRHSVVNPHPCADDAHPAHVLRGAGGGGHHEAAAVPVSPRGPPPDAKHAAVGRTADMSCMAREEPAQHGDACHEGREISGRCPGDGGEGGIFYAHWKCVAMCYAQWDSRLRCGVLRGSPAWTNPGIEQVDICLSAPRRLPPIQGSEGADAVKCYTACVIS